MGFLRVLPFEIGTGDRVFLGVASYIAINLLWMRFFDQFSGTYVGVALGVAVAVAIVRWG
jgi:predicted small integral membrane protein